MVMARPRRPGHAGARHCDADPRSLLACCPSTELALIEEIPLRDPRPVRRGDLDVGWREQEYLIRDPVDRAMQPEDQTRGEVYEPPGVAIDHLGQVHDNR